MENIDFLSIITTILVVVFEFILNVITKDKKHKKGLIKLFTFLVIYLFPIAIIVWLNISSQVKNTKLTSTIIALNIGVVIFNLLQTKNTETNTMLCELAKKKTEDVEKINQINDVQVEKVKSIKENQKYILSELSKINDRIIQLFQK